MNNITKFFLTGVFSSSIALSANAQATLIPTIDGDLSDAAWTNAKTFEIKSIIDVATVSNMNDLSGSVKVLWTADSIYYAVEVKDDSLYSGETDGYKNDNVCIYLDLFNQKSLSYADSTQMYWEISWYNDKNGNLIVGGRRSSDWGLGLGRIGANIAKKVVNKQGYTLELAAAWNKLGALTPTVGTKIGFDCKLSDNDGQGRAQLAWRDITDGGWDKPAVFGTVSLNADGSVSPVTITAKTDGIMDPFWAIAPAQNITSVIDTSTAKTATDFSGNIRMRWDSDSAYFFIDIKDDSLFNGAGQDYEKDNIVLYFDLYNKKSETYIDSTQMYWEIYFFKDGNGGRTGQTWKTYPINYKKVITNKMGYTMEVAISWKTIGFKPSSGAILGFDTKLNDNDGEGRDQYAWYDISDNGWQYPKVFGTIQLIEGGSVAFLSKRPAASKKVTATLTNKTVNISWMAVPGAIGYKISRNGVVIATVNSLSISDDLVSGGSYTYGIRSIDKDSVVSNEQKAFVNAVISSVKPEISVVFNVYPNPASDYIAIISAQTIKSISIVDISGKVILKKSIDTNETIVQLSGLKSGIYFISVANMNEQTSIQKLIVK